MDNCTPLQGDLPVEVTAPIGEFSPTKPRGRHGSHTLTTANPAGRIATTWVNATWTSSEGFHLSHVLATSFWSSVEPPRFL